MATNVTRGPLPQVRWGAVFAGVAFALAAHVCLGLFGASLGYMAEARDSRAIGIGAGLFTLMVSFTSALIGATVAARIAASADSRSAVLHGTLVWCIGLVAGAVFLSGTLAASVMGASYAWNGGIVTNGADMGPGSPIDGAAGEAAAASLLGAFAALAGLAGAFVGAIVGREAMSFATARERRWMAATSASETIPPMERRDESSDTVWSDPAFNRRRSAVEDRRHHHN